MKNNDIIYWYVLKSSHTVLVIKKYIKFKLKKLKNNVEYEYFRKTYRTIVFDEVFENAYEP
jgi:hypothetical protein